MELPALKDRRERAVRATRLLSRPTTYTSLARETLWRLRPPPAPEQVPLSWPLVPSELSNVSLGWPFLTRWERQKSEPWTNSLRSGLASHVPVGDETLRQPRGGIIIFKMYIGKRGHEIAIDCRDTSAIDGEVARRVPLYFKFQHSLDGYSYGSVVPGGYVVGQSQLYHYLPQLRRLRDTKAALYDVYGRFGLFHPVFPQRTLVDELNQPRRFGPYGGCDASAVRRALVEELRQSGLNFHGGARTVLYSDAMVELSRARLCIDAPGRGSFCFRLCDYLAVGSCIVAIPHENRMHVPLVDREQIVYTRPDGSDLRELCEYLLGDDQARANLVRRSREYFDRYLEPRQLAAYYLSTALDRLG